MFNIYAIIQMINTNKDELIQKEEVSAFQNKLKNDSIFSGYFNSVNEDLSINEFTDNLFRIYEELGVEANTEPDFLSKKDTRKFKKYVKKEKADYDKEQKKWKDNLLKNLDKEKEYFKRFYLWKFQSEQAFDMQWDEWTTQILNDEEIDIYSELQNLKPTQPISMEVFKASRNFGIDLPQDFIFDDIDWSNSKEIFRYLTFYENTFSNTSQEHFPEGYNPQQVFEKGKSIGLGINDVHNMGYTGNGVSYAIIDSGTLDGNGEQHNDIHFREYNVSQYATGDPNHFHGRAVSYIAQEIAPDADLYYYAQANSPDNNIMGKTVVDNLKSILEKNRTLPDNQKIRFVSMSMPLYGGQEAEKVVKELEQQGVWVYYSGCREDREFHGYLGKINPNGSSDDFNNYQIEAGAGISIMPDGEEAKYVAEDMLYVNSGDRTVPDPSSPTAYRHDSRASQSWSIPVIAGYYVLACQADPTMTKERFLNLASRTARTTESNLPIHRCVGNPENEDDWIPEGRTEETVEIKIIDIKALLEAIETEKSEK